MSSSDEIQAYFLVACTGPAIMLNLFMLFWHCFKVHAHEQNRFLKYSMAGVYISYILLGVAVTMLVLFRDTQTDFLCQGGGVFLLFCVQISIWMLAMSCATLLLWKRAQLPWRQFDSPYQGHKWSLPIFVLIIVVMCLVLAIVSYLPLTSVQSNESILEYHYVCTPLRLPGNGRWGFSAFLIILLWIALILAVLPLTASIVYIFKISKSRNLMNGYTNCRLPTGCLTTLKHLHKSNRKQFFTIKTTITLIFSVFCWLIVLLITSINYFSTGSIIVRTEIQWALGFLIGMIILIHPLIMLTLLCLTRCGCINDRKDRKGNLVAAWDTGCPKSIESLMKMDASHQEKDIAKYIVGWKTSDGSHVSGVMKVFRPKAVVKWHNEVKTVSKLAPLHNPNIARYLWESPQNNFATAICALTGDAMRPDSSIICRLQYKNGTLQDLLTVQIGKLSEIGMHKVTLDVASGLEFVHQHNIVHNGLSTKTVYMESISERTGMKAVIGDFENSYEVSPFIVRRSPDSLHSTNLGSSMSSIYSISQNLDRQKSNETNKFAPDIRSFGLVVLEMLVSLSEHNKVTKAPKQRKVSRSSAKDDNKCNRSEASLDMGSIVASVELDGNTDITSIVSSVSQKCKDTDDVTSRCSCSTDVTDIRVSVKQHHHHQQPPEIPPRYTRREGSKFTPFNSSKDNCSQISVGSNHSDGVQHIQRRELPAIPTDNIELQEEGHIEMHTRKSHLIAAQQLSTESSSLDAYDNSMSPSPEDSSGKETVPSTGENSLNSSPREHIEVPLSPTEEGTSSLILSVGSFETIYEEDENGEPRNQNNFYNAKRFVHKIPVSKRKLHGHKKHVSNSTLDDSVMSGETSDSGLGSSHYDMDSFSLPLTNVPGNRDTLYSLDSEAECYSLPLLYLSNTDKNHAKMKSLDSGIVSFGGSIEHLPHTSQVNETSQAAKPIPEVDFDIEGEADDFSFPDLRIRKKPCRGHHDRLGQPCHHHHHNNNPVHSINRQSSDNSNSDEPIYDRISCSSKSPRSEASQPLRLTASNIDKHVHLNRETSDDVRSTCSSKFSNDCSSASSFKPNVHSYTKRHSSAPKLGVSAVNTARRLSNASSISKNSETAISRTTHSSNSHAIEQSKNRTCSRASGASSVSSLLNSNALVCQNAANKTFSSNGRKGQQKLPVPVSINQRSGLTHQHIKHCQQLADGNPLVQTMLMSANESKARKTLAILRKKGYLGFTASQLMPLLTSCWWEDPAPSSDEIMKRLDQLLPTARV